MKNSNTEKNGNVVLKMKCLNWFRRIKKVSPGNR